MQLKDNLNDVELYNHCGHNIISFRKGYKEHHINGPSYIQNNGHKVCCINDLLHNAKGPAVIYEDGKDYYIDGKWINEKEWHEAKR